MKLRAIAVSAKLEREDAINFRRNMRNNFKGLFIEEKPYYHKPTTPLYSVVRLPFKDEPIIVTKEGKPSPHELVADEAELLRKI